MTARSIAEFLTEFGAPDGETPALELCGATAPAPIWMQDPEEKHQTALAEALESGRTAGLEEARAEFAAALERERADFERRLAQERQKWLQEEAEQLHERLAKAIRGIEENIGECVARVLRPLVVDSLRRQMIDQLIDHIATMIGSNEKIAIRITGPADLLAGLRARLASVPAAIDYEAQDKIDVSVTAEQTAIETQLEAWIDLVRGETE